MLDRPNSQAMLSQLYRACDVGSIGHAAPSDAWAEWSEWPCCLARALAYIFKAMGPSVRRSQTARPPLVARAATGSGSLRARLLRWPKTKPRPAAAAVA